MTAFQKGYATIRDFSVLESALDVRKRATTLVLGGEKLTATKRFWASFSSRFALSDTVFKYWSHAEVFNRVVEVKGDTPLRYTIDHPATGQPNLLAIVAEHAMVVEAEQVELLHGRFNAIDPSYHEGIMAARYIPKSGEMVKAIGCDDFRNRFVMEVPIDGYGEPRTFLELLRLVCTNGAMGMNAAFRSSVKLGKDPINDLERCLGSYDDGEGFGKLRDRFLLAQQSWASMREMSRFATLLERMPDQHLKLAAIPQISKVFGDMGQLYGVVNCNALPAKLQQRLNTRGTVYDLINFASELATHHTDPATSRTLQGFIGELIAEEFDLEGTAAKVKPEFRDRILVAGLRPVSSVPVVPLITVS